MQIGRKIYWRKASGEIILATTPVSVGRETTKEEDFAFYPQLAGIDPELVDVIQLDYGQYDDEFIHAYPAWVDPDTGALEFSYPDSSGEQPAEPVYQTPLTDQVAEFKTRQDATEAAILALMDVTTGV